MDPCSLLIALLAIFLAVLFVQGYIDFFFRDPSTRKRGAKKMLFVALFPIVLCGSPCAILVTKIHRTYSQTEIDAFEHQIQSGMSKDELLQRFGPPTQIVDETFWIYWYDIFHLSGRRIYFRKDGRVDRTGEL
jgi:hypothetical protein